MRDRNKCNPQLGQRRLAIGGNGDRSRRFGSGMVRPFPDTSGSTTSGRRRLAQSRCRWCLHRTRNSTNESTREHLKCSWTSEALKHRQRCKL